MEGRVREGVNSSGTVGRTEGGGCFVSSVVSSGYRCATDRVLWWPLINLISAVSGKFNSFLLIFWIRAKCQSERGRASFCTITNSPTWGQREDGFFIFLYLSLRDRR